MDNEELYALIQQYLSGNDYAFTLFYEQTKNKVFANIYSYVKDVTVAEDILSDVYISFMNNTHKISRSKSILGLLYVISRNLSMNHLKRNKRHENIEDHTKLFVTHNDAHKNLERDEIIQVMKKVLNNDMFQVVILRLINELEYKEIAEIMNKKETTIRSLYSDGIKKVKEEMYAR